MITSELIGYIKSEFAKGKTREEIHAVLVAEGGWSEADLNEGFRTVIPMQGFAQSSMVTTHKSFSAKSSLSLWKIPLILVVLGAFGFAIWWFYRTPVVSLWNSLVNSVTELPIPFGTNNNAENTEPQNNAVVENTVSVRNCGIGTTPDLKNSLTYENNAVLNCLGDSALRCEDAQAVLENALFPTIFQIIKNQDTCHFKLSYEQDSTLIDITGQKLAGQYILCPVGIVKMIDESNPKAPIFKAPSVDNLSKYASQIYFYGTLGLFMENNVDQNKIQALGCSGPYINSVIESYRKMQSKSN